MVVGGVEWLVVLGGSDFGFLDERFGMGSFLGFEVEGGFWVGGNLC